jgi:hypothetical protein
MVLIGLTREILAFLGTTTPIPKEIPGVEGIGVEIEEMIDGATGTRD